MATEKKGTVYFFTNEVNISFVQNEIYNLSSRFSVVNVYAFKKGSDLDFEKNVSVKEVDFNNYSTSTVLFKHPFTVIGISIIELVKNPKYFRYFSKFTKAISELLRSVYLADQLKQEIKDRDAVCYTFWFNQWATVLSLLVKRNVIGRYYSRTHGADLYEYRVPETKSILFRWFQLKYVSKVFSVSEMGKEYLQLNYPQHASKITTSYLGSRDHGASSFDPDHIFTIVSCANIRNIKRIHLIPEILKRIDFKLKWIHIGNENLKSKDVTIPLYIKNKEALQSKVNIIVETNGSMSNEEVLKLYKEQNINLFVSVSETEGLPVSMMEAISFGIPVLSTDVGGCKEIVTETTGILIKKDFDIEQVAELIEKISSSELNTLGQRNKIREFWKQKFNSEINFGLFVKQLREA